MIQKSETFDDFFVEKSVKILDLRTYEVSFREKDQYRGVAVPVPIEQFSGTDFDSNSCPRGQERQCPN